MPVKTFDVCAFCVGCKTPAPHGFTLYAIIIIISKKDNRLFVLAVVDEMLGLFVLLPQPTSTNVCTVRQSDFPLRKGNRRWLSIGEEPQEEPR